jgi:hypothetical protein
MLIFDVPVKGISNTYSSHSLSDGSSNGNSAARTRTRTIAGLTGGSGNLNDSDGLGLGAVDSRSASAGDVPSGLGGRGFRARLGLYQS